jgi:hypothetical protein
MLNLTRMGVRNARTPEHSHHDGVPPACATYAHRILPEPVAAESCAAPTYRRAMPHVHGDRLHHCQLLTNGSRKAPNFQLRPSDSALLDSPVPRTHTARAGNCKPFRLREGPLLTAAGRSALRQESCVSDRLHAAARDIPFCGVPISSSASPPGSASPCAASSGAQLVRAIPGSAPSRFAESAAARGPADDPGRTPLFAT